MYTQPKCCRACGSSELKEVFSFDKPMPLANDFCKPSQERRGFVPLRVMFCSKCTLAQLGETVDPSVLYKNYLYVTSNSQTMRRHFERLVKDLQSENGLGTILEVGSNDGLFLDFALKHDFTDALGVDPAENLAGQSVSPRITAFFNPDCCHLVEKQMRSVDFIIARHCFAHMEFRPFMDACSRLAHEKTLIGIEVPYAEDLLTQGAFDTIYSEHTSYITLKSIAALLKDYPFHIHGVVRYGIHGGCVLIMLRHNDSGIEPHLSAEEYLAQENITQERWIQFSVNTHRRIGQLKETVQSLNKEGKIVSMFGASAKSSVVVSACGFDNRDIAFITDNSPLKPGRLSPGTDIPVVEESEMLSLHPNVSICCAWNFKVEILAKMKRWTDRGGRFVFPTADGWEIV